jgi:hypothetical protein
MRRMTGSRTIRSAFLVVVALCLGACAGLAGPRTITLSEADLARLIERHGPFEKRLLDVLDVHMDTPRVRLLVESNRLSTQLAVRTTERLGGRAYQGHIELDYGLRYDEVAQAIRITQVRVNEFQIDDLPAPRQAAINRLGGLIAEQLLDDLALYRFKPADLTSAAGLGYRPGAVTVTARGVEITLAPIAR